jgi:hypothetical protein
MSMNTMIRSQIQITHRKISNIVQKMFNSGYELDAAARDIPSPSRRGGRHRADGYDTGLTVKAQHSPDADYQHHPPRVTQPARPKYPHARLRRAPALLLARGWPERVMRRDD